MSTPYQIYACAELGRAVYDSGVHAGQFHASYTEATEPQLALDRCLEQFPTADGWTKHYVQISCFHNGFQFSVLTFSTEQLVKVK